MTEVSTFARDLLLFASGCLVGSSALLSLDEFRRAIIHRSLNRAFRGAFTATIGGIVFVVMTAVFHVPAIPVDDRTRWYIVLLIAGSLTALGSVFVRDKGKA